MTELALLALVVAAFAWIFVFTGVARRSVSLAAFLFILFFAIAAILFGVAVLQVR